MNKKTKVLATSIATIAMTASLAVGGTYALFTSEDKVNIAVSSGTVKVNANVNEGSVVMTSIDQDVTASKTFANGGTAVWAEDTVKLDKITPGDKISFNIDITNESNVNVLYRTVVSCVDGIELFAGLKVSLDYASDTAEAQVFDGMTAYGAWTALTGVETATAVDTVAVTVEFPYLTTSQNEYQGLSTEIEFSVEAVQGNADVSDDTAAEGETLAYNASDLKLISKKAANGYTFKNETIKLGSDIDLGASASTFAMRSTPVSNWTPIGTETNPFQGTFDGNGFKVSNLYINEPEMENVGFIGKGQSATIQNVTFENATVMGNYSVAVAIGGGTNNTSSNVTVTGDVYVYAEVQRAAGIFNGYGSAYNCSVNANEGSLISSAGSFVGAIGGWNGEGAFKISGCYSNINVTGYGAVGAITGLLHYGNTVENCVAENVVLTKTRVDGQMSIGMAGGCVVFDTSANHFVKNNTFTNITFEGSGTTAVRLNGLVGSGYSGDWYEERVVRENNTITNFTDNTWSFSVLAEGLYQSTDKSTLYIMSADGMANWNTMLKTNANNAGVTTIELMADVDMTGKPWTPVDNHADTKNEWNTWNGNGHTISNLTINGQAMFTRFAASGDKVVSNLTFDNATVTSGGLNVAVLVGQTYQNVLLDNVDVKNSSLTGAYKVAPLIGTVYNESSTTVTATLKNCDVANTKVTCTSYDFCTAGMVAFVYEGNNDKVAFENCTVKNVELYAKPNDYTLHAWIYVNDADTDACFNEVDGVTVENVTFTAL